MFSPEQAIEKASIASVSGLGKRLQNRETRVVLYELNRSIVCIKYQVLQTGLDATCSRFDQCPLKSDLLVDSGT